MDIIQILLLGIIQGLLEWIPVSSEGQIVIFLTQVIGIDSSTALALALFVHVGTMLVVLVIFWSLFWHYFLSVRVITMPSDQVSSELQEEYHGVKIVLLATVGTGITGVLSLFFLEELLASLSTTFGFDISELFMVFVGGFLIITGLLLRYQRQIRSSMGERTFHSLTYIEAFVLGLLQGFSAIPGISRSGVTLTVLFFLGLSAKEAFKGSLIIGVPAVAGSTGLLYLKSDLAFSFSSVIIGTLQFSFIEIGLLLITVFIVGYLTVGLILRNVNRIPFAAICIIIGLLIALRSLFAIIF